VFIPHVKNSLPAPYWISCTPCTNQVTTFDEANKYCEQLNQLKTSPVIFASDVHRFLIATEDDLRTPFAVHRKANTAILTRIEKPDSLPALVLRDNTRIKYRGDTRLSGFSDPVFFRINAK
jgi:hypothetical protein